MLALERSFSAQTVNEWLSYVRLCLFLSIPLLGANFSNIGHDRTIRIWSVSNRVETARLAQNSPISSVAWMPDDNGIITLGQDGMISKWTRNASVDALGREVDFS